MDFAELDRLFRYDPETGDIFNRTKRGGSRGRSVKVGSIATYDKGDGYLRIVFTRNGRSVRYCAHRVSWLLHYREDPGKMEVDHINHDRADNRIENLRLTDCRGNRLNHTKRSDNTSGIVGVCWSKRDCKWQVQISNFGKRMLLGYFKDKFEAICCRKSAENRFGYHRNYGK